MRVTYRATGANARIFNVLANGELVPTVPTGYPGIILSRGERAGQIFGCGSDQHFNKGGRANTEAKQEERHGVNSYPPHQA